MPSVKRLLYSSFSVLFILVMFSISTRASHVVGGEITYTCLGNNTYDIELRLFRDCSGIALPASATIQVYDGARVHLGSFSASVLGLSYLKISKPACATVSPNFCVQTGRYPYASITLPPSTSGYVFVFQECCRNANISNLGVLSSSPGITVTSSTSATLPCNSSPKFNNNPPLVIPFNLPVSINASATDPDGDSLYYELCSPLMNSPSRAPFDTIPFVSGQYSKNPIPSVPHISIDPGSGFISGSISQIGNYLVAICVHEYRNGVHIGSIQRDYQFNAVQAWRLFATVRPDSLVKPDCAGYNNGKIGLSVVGGTPPYIYQWSNNAHTRSIKNLTAGNYTVVITDANRCTDTLTIALNEPSGMTLNVLTIKPATCTGINDGAVTVEITGGTKPYTALWDNGVSGLVNNTLYGGTHKLYVSDSLGCRDTFEVVIGELNNMRLVLDSLRNVSCKGGHDGFIEVKVTGNVGPVNFAWSNGSQTNQAVGLSAGVYNLRVTDSKGCGLVSSFVITEPPVFRARVDSTTNTSCENVQDGKIHLTMKGGTPPYTINSAVGEVHSRTIIKMPMGNYSFSVVDSLGCKVLLNATIGINPPLVFTNMEIRPPTCHDGDDGYARPTVEGGKAPYTFHWSNKKAGPYQDNLKPGRYDVSVVDKNGCNLYTTFDVPSLPVPELHVTWEPSTCMQKADAKVAMEVEGPPKQYDYLIDGIPLQQINGKILAGYHTVSAIDEDGCELNKNIRIESSQERVLFIPNTFTPNGDGLNDHFEIWADEACFPNPKLSVFNRWGQEVFSTEDPFYEFWDGTIDGAAVPQNVYYYIFESDHFRVKGHITVYF